MKQRRLALVALVFAVVLAPPARAAEPAPVPWLLQFFQHHATPAPKCKDPKSCTADEQALRDDMATVRYEVASAATEVAYDPAEPPLFRGPHGRARTALRLATIDAHESGLQPGPARSCHKDTGGEQACGVGQVHPGAYGLRLVGEKIVRCQAPADDCIDAVSLLADPVLTQRVMLHILRLGGLGLYTGEGATEGEASLTIREWEAGWFKAHPLLPVDDDILTAIGEDAGLP